MRFGFGPAMVAFFFNFLLQPFGPSISPRKTRKIKILPFGTDPDHACCLLSFALRSFRRSRSTSTVHVRVRRVAVYVHVHGHAHAAYVCPTIRPSHWKPPSAEHTSHFTHNSHFHFHFRRFIWHLAHKHSALFIIPLLSEPLVRPK
jgi:hypothetical protein